MYVLKEKSKAILTSTHKILCEELKKIEPAQEIMILFT